MRRFSQMRTSENSVKIRGICGSLPGFWILIALLPLLLIAPQLDAADEQMQVLGRRVEGRAGEICLVCQKPLEAGDGAYLAEGQRLPVHRGGCEARLRAQPLVWLARLQPSGALFDSKKDSGALSRFWFFTGAYILLGLVFGALCAHRALHKACCPVTWFGLGLAFNVFAYLFLWMRPQGVMVAPAGVPPGLGKISATFAPRACPRCGAANHPAAAACLDCGAKLESLVVSEVVKAGVGRPEHR